MASTKVILFHKNIKKNGEVPIFLRIIKDRKTKYVSLGIAVLPKFWDENNQCVRSKHPNATRMNNYIQHKKAEATDVVLSLVTESKYVKPTAIKTAIHGLAPLDFFEYADRFVKQFEARGYLGNYYRQKAIIGKLKAFVGDKPLHFSDITVSFLKEYENYLRISYKNSQNTISTNFKIIRRIINEAISEEKVPAEHNPFLKYKTKWESSEKVFLTEDELKALENLKLKPELKKFHHRNLYVFACYAGGIRIADLFHLKWENFDGRHILLKTQKTGSVVSILLPEKALEILTIYQPEKPKKSEFMFPFLKTSDNLAVPKVLYNRISSLTALANKELNILAKMAGIEKHIHFHTSRHTWATRALRKGMRIEYVSKLMGHASIKTTQVYAKIVNADLDKAMKVFDD